MSWIYIVSWVLVVNYGDYGSTEISFEKQFTGRSQAVSFLKKAPKECKEMVVDSIKFDGGTKLIELEPDVVDRYRYPYGHNTFELYNGDLMFRKLDGSE